MSKKYFFGIALIMSIVLFGCNASDDSSTVFFTGSIIEIHDQSAVVQGEIGETAGNVSVDLSVNKNESFQVGDKVKVGYDGIVLESYPLQIKTLSVELVE